MLDNKRQNAHHSKLPDRGEIVTIPEILYRHKPHLQGKWIVTHFSLTDQASRHSIGIHLAHLEKLSNRNIHATIAGHYLIEE